MVGLLQLYLKLSQKRSRLYAIEVVIELANESTGGLNGYTGGGFVSMMLWKPLLLITHSSVCWTSLGAYQEGVWDDQGETRGANYEQPTK